MAHSNTIVSQILRFVPRHEFRKLSTEHDGKRRSDALSRWTQFVSMAVAQLGGRSSLRDIESAINSQKHLNYHLGCGSIKRSSLARANKKLSYGFYEDLFSRLYALCQERSGKHRFRFKGKLFSLDATLLDVSMKVFPQANYNNHKAAFKLHVGLDHDGLIPAFATVTPGKTQDQIQARLMRFPKGSVLVFDKGYSDYGWHNQLTEQGIYWVTRARGNARYRVLARHPVNRSQGVTSDQTIEFTSERSSRKRLRPVRRIGYRDAETGRHYIFTSNRFDWSAKTIADIYKERWQVELFFKWIKQNLKIKAFMGNSDNAVMTQVMIALCVYLILAYFKFQSRIAHSLQQISRLIHVNLFARRDLIQLFKPPPDPGISSPQMGLL